MISRYEAVLNGQALGGISADILVLDIRHTAPAFTNETFTPAKRQGGRIYRRQLNKTTVTITFEIHTYDIRERQRICNEVQRWARNGGILQTNDREGQRLRCVCDTFPVISSAMRWTDPLTVVFSAYAYPYWEELIPTKVTLSGTSGSSSVFVPGCVQDEAVVEATITANAALTTVNLIVNSRTMSLTGLSVAAGSTIKLIYDDDMIQSIKTGSTSLLANRSGADDLLVDCGDTNTFKMSANASATVEFSVRGLWL